MKVFLIEDEQLLARQLTSLLKKIEPGVEILGHTNSIETSVAWLDQHPAPQLIFMDIELADGQCFEIFNRIKVSSPVIFTTAYDEFALKAFKVNSIDYLLKPIKEEELVSALNKWKQLQRSTANTHSIESITGILNSLVKEKENSYRKRFLVKHGQKMVSVNTSDIAFFNARNTLNFITTRTKQKYLVDYTLDEIEELVHPNQFFRANRQFILAHDIITAVHPWFNGKLKVDLSLPLEEEIIVSRDKAPQLKAWMGA